MIFKFCEVLLTHSIEQEVFLSVRTTALVQMRKLLMFGMIIIFIITHIRVYSYMALYS